VQSLPSHPLLACRRGRVGITTEYRGGVGGRSRRGGTPVFRRDRRCRVPTPLSGGPHPRRTPSKRRPVTCVPRNAAALFPGVVRPRSPSLVGAPWSPRNPCTRPPHWGSRTQSPPSHPPCVPTWQGGDHHRIPGWRGRPFPARGHAVFRRDRYCRVPTPLSGGPDSHPRAPTKRKLWITGFRVPRNARNTRNCRTPLPS